MRLLGEPTCPHVQRVAIALGHTDTEHEREEIDLADPPPWFHDLSPLGKAPVLAIGDVGIFASAAIMDFIDHTTGGALLPHEPLRRAMARGWIAIADGCLGDYDAMTRAEDEAGFRHHRAELMRKLGRVEGALGDGPYWSGDDFGQVDMAYAPLLQRLEHLARVTGRFDLSALPAVEDWTYALLRHRSVRAELEGGRQELDRWVSSQEGFLAGQVE